MGITELFELLDGLALFLYGMQMMSNFERIGDHILSIAQAYSKIETK